MNIFTEKLDEEEEHDSDAEEEDGRAKKLRQKRHLNPIQEFMEKAREKMKLVVKEFKFESGLSKNRKDKKEAL